MTLPAYGVAAFQSTHDAISAQAALSRQFAVCVMPTPRFITASCGIAIRFCPGDREAIAAALGALFPGGGYQLVMVPENAAGGAP